MKMTKIRYWIWRIRNYFNKWRYTRNQMLSEKGLCAARYILDKYFLGTRHYDYISEYEQFIEMALKTMREKHMFEHTGILENREDAAFVALVRLITFASREQQRAFYEYACDWPNIDTFKEYIRLGVLI